jgi:cytochrome c peroxidase
MGFFMRWSILHQRLQGIQSTIRSICARRRWIVCIVIFLTFCIAFQASSEIPHPTANTFFIDEGMLDQMIEQMPALPGNIGPLADVPIPHDNPMTTAKVELGKMLFFDPRLSGNNHWACASCHNPALAFGDGLPTSLGFGDEQPLDRHASTLYNVGYNQHHFWDGRAASLEEQAKMPIQNSREMNSRPEELIKKLSAIAGYRSLFLEVFGEEPTFDNVAKAIATFERTITSKNSRFDRYVMGEQDALTAQEKRGLILFLSKAACSRCHNGPNFTDDQFHNLGLPQVGPLKEDLGRYGVTQEEKDKRAFKTPTLRNIDLTAPYMHNGVFETLEEVMDFYNQGGGEDALKSEEIFPLHLTEEEQNDVIAFLHSLRGDLQLVGPPLLP